ncbi:MAG: helix-turn-helix transcriptional regulator [Spirochaetia bacterium]|nr:helix-turn-helix transcriptional regulator [Spirochaetia bacterium]
MASSNFDSHERFVEINNHIHLSLVHATTIVGNESWSGRNRIPWHRIFLIAAAKGGIGGEVIDHSLKTKNSVSLKPGKMYFLPAGHDFEFAFHRGMRLLGFHFKLELFSGFDLLQNQTRSVSREIPAAELAGFDEALSNLKSIGDMAALRGLFLSTVGKLVGLRLERTLSLIAAHRKYRGVFDFLEKNCRAEIPVGRFARQAGLSVGKFSRDFSREIGIPFKTFLTRKLFARASEALLGSDQKVREISHDLGFSSEFYFSRFVKKHSGLPPTEYRAMARPKRGNKAGLYM